MGGEEPRVMVMVGAREACRDLWTWKGFDLSVQF